MTPYGRFQPDHTRPIESPRRITAPERVVQGLESLRVPLVTREYHGPVFAMDTNFEYIGPVLNGYIHKEMLNEESIENHKDHLHLQRLA